MLLAACQRRLPSNRRQSPLKNRRDGYRTVTLPLANGIVVWACRREHGLLKTSTSSELSMQKAVEECSEEGDFWTVKNNNSVNKFLRWDAPCILRLWAVAGVISMPTCDGHAMDKTVVYHFQENLPAHVAKTGSMGGRVHASQPDSIKSECHS